MDVEDRDRSQLVGRWTLDQPHALIGRDPRADLVLDHEQVSRRHAYLQQIEGGFLRGLREPDRDRA